MSDREKLGRGEYLVAALLLVALVGNCQGPASAQIVLPDDPQSERLAAENLNRVKKLCRARPDCVDRNLSAAEEFQEIRMRVQTPQARWHNHRWVQMPPPVEVAEKAARLRKGLSYTYRSHLVEVDGNFVLDAEPALREAKETLWHFWIDYDADCWLVGEEAPGTNFYACYDYGFREIREKTNVEK